MNTMVKNIPNTVTCLNLLSGCLATVAAFTGNITLAAGFICLAALFDFLDGMLARLLGAYSPLGKELDSLADIISFGMAPATMVYTHLAGDGSTPLAPCTAGTLLPCTAFLIAVFSGLRLAKFNIDTRQTSSFLGLPVPANALFWTGLCHYALQHPLHPGIVIALVLLFSGLLVCELPMFSLKFKNLSLRENALRYLLIAAAVVGVALYGLSALAAVIGLYILLSLLFWRP
ncbi:MAG: CDP-diacylglycerol--serine O-phosphatidyltransferase [Coprobacter sp.]|nr:CDP-diacylglycerol--serine O-phosphatidyltransferase [Coprobacter sp.]